MYFGLPLSSEEAAPLAKDVIIANKILKKEKLDDKEIKLLLNEGVATKKEGKLSINQEKILGLQFDTYQYVVTVEKYAHHYATLKKHWEKLSALRKALLLDFNDFVLKDPTLFHNFMRELMLSRTRLEKLSEGQALDTLNEMIENGGGRI